MNFIKKIRESWACSKAKRAHIRANPTCACCGSKKSFLRIAIEAHHIIPVHVRPDLAAVDSNLISLCRTCHFFVGHLRNWSAWNSTLTATIEAIRYAWINAQTKELK